MRHDIKSLNVIHSLVCQKFRQTLTISLCAAISLLELKPALAGNALITNNNNIGVLPGGNLTSNNGCFSLQFQTDGNTVLYHNIQRKPLWASNTPGQKVKYNVMQADGNFVIYNTNNRPIWASGTDRRGGTQLVVQDDGNAVIYTPQGRPVWATNTVSACNTNNSSSLPTTVTQANNSFKLQYNNPTWNPDGPPSSNNCGPTSLAMLRKLLGKESAGISVQTSINQARQLMNASGTGNTSDAQLKTGIANSGLRYDDRMYNGTWAQLDRDLADGKAILGWGYYDTQWRNQFPNYSQTGNGRTDHLNTILGKTANGNYLVGDPMYRGGVVEMSRNQVAVYFSYGGGGHDGRPYYLAVYR
jgi:hypothetical protein